MKRRKFIQFALAALGTAPVAALGVAPGIKKGVEPYRPEGRRATVMTVTGARPSGALGWTLPHEHVLVDFVGVEEMRPGRYDRQAVFETVRPHLERLKSAGGATLVECTPQYLGRDPRLLRQLSEATGVHIITNTGYYGARNDQHVPEHAYTDSVDALAERWISEWENGIDDTDIRPGFIKIGVDGGPLSDIDEKLVRAACRTHLETGLTIAAHTGPARPAFEELAVLAEEGVDPSAWIWVHAQNEDDAERHVEAGKRGAWIEFDGYSPGQTKRYLEWVSVMREHNLLPRVLLSQDNGWYSVGEPGGGDFQSYTALFTEFVPALKEEGFTDEEIRQLVVVNPAEAFRIRVRGA